MLAVGLLMLTAGPALLRGMNHAVTNGVQHALAPTSPFGTSVSVNGNGARPDLDVAVGRPVDTSAIGHAPEPAAGSRLVVVDLRVRNTGTLPWDLSAGLPMSLVGADGVRYSPDPRHRRVSAGRLFRAGDVLEPKADLAGFVVFELPVGVLASEVDLTLGPGLPKVVRWRAG